MIKGILVMAAIFLMVNVPQVHASSLENSQIFKATVIENGMEFEWEYDNPDQYEYEHGNTVIKNDEARRQVERMFRYLNISPNAKVDKMVEQLKKDGHVNLERLEIKWVDSQNQLYTWVWNKKN